MPTEQEVNKFISDVKLHQTLNKKVRDMLDEVTNMCGEVNGLNIQGYFSVVVDAIEDRIVFSYISSVKDRTLDIYTHPNFSILWNQADWEIAKREIKDIFYETRKSIKEKEEAKLANQGFWSKVKSFFKFS